MRVLFYGDSNTYGYIIGGGRLEQQDRFPCIVAQTLNNSIEAIECGLNGRNAAFDAPGERELLGGNSFQTTLLANQPLDGLVIMLGTNDVFPPIEHTVSTIVQNIKKMLHIALEMYHNLWILLLAPVPISQDGVHMSEVVYGANAALLKQDLATPFSKLAQEEHIDFFDTQTVVPYADGIDGVHLTAKAHHAIGLALADKIAQIIDRHVHK